MRTPPTGHREQLWDLKKSPTRIRGVLTSGPGTVTRYRDGTRSDVVGIVAEEKEIANWKYGAWWKAYRP